MNITLDEMKFVEDEEFRINALPVQGEQSIAVQLDMKQWALKQGYWPNEEYGRIMFHYAGARGWTQEGFSGMEIIE